MTIQQQPQKAGPDLKALGLKSALEVIDILALLRIDGEPVINDDNIVLNPQAKAKAVIEYYQQRFGVQPNDLPYMASLIKKDLINRKRKVGVAANV